MNIDDEWTSFLQQTCARAHAAATNVVSACGASSSVSPGDAGAFSPVSGHGGGGGGDNHDDMNSDDGIDDADDEEVEIEFARTEWTDRSSLMDRAQLGYVPECAPTPSDLYISTKTIISFLNTTIDLALFWRLELVPFHLARNGIVKKLIETKSLTPDALKQVITNFQQQVGHKECQIVTHHDGTQKRRPFKDSRKLSVGLSNRDVRDHRCKKIGAFQNCIVVLLRLWLESHARFREFHIKIFNTGKIEIVGVKQATMHAFVMIELIRTLQPYFPEVTLTYDAAQNEVVLINSNFSCGFFVDREQLYSVLSRKYNLNCMYDPCNYPGIQCKYTALMDEFMKEHGSSAVYDYASAQELRRQREAAGHPVVSRAHENIGSFKIFRTGSVLIAGRCEEDVIYRAYHCICAILAAELPNIYQVAISDHPTATEEDVKKKQLLVGNVAESITPEKEEMYRKAQQIMMSLRRTSGNKRKMHRKRSFVVVVDSSRPDCVLSRDDVACVQMWDTHLDKKRMRVMGPEGVLPTRTTPVRMPKSGGATSRAPKKPAVSVVV